MVNRDEARANAKRGLVNAREFLAQLESEQQRALHARNGMEALLGRMVARAQDRVTNWERRVKAWS